MTLFPRIRRLVPDLPPLAAGGIADGRTMAAALVRGAAATLQCDIAHAGV